MKFRIPFEKYDFCFYGGFYEKFDVIFLPSDRNIVLHWLKLTRNVNQPLFLRTFSSAFLSGALTRLWAQFFSFSSSEVVPRNRISAEKIGCKWTYYGWIYVHILQYQTRHVWHVPNEMQNRIKTRTGSNSWFLVVIIKFIFYSIDLACRCQKSNEFSLSFEMKSESERTQSQQ